MIRVSNDLINYNQFRFASIIVTIIGLKQYFLVSEIGTYCGLQKPDVIETSTNEAYVYFQSDNREYMRYRGFSLNFTASQES